MFFLPLYRTVVQSLSSGRLSDFFSSATVPQLAAVVFIQNAPKLAKQQASLASLERQFAQIIHAGHQANMKLDQAFQTCVSERFSVTQFAQGVNLLGGLQVGLLADEYPVAESRYLDDQGQWLFTFSPEYQKEVMPLQKVHFNEFDAEVSLSDAQNRTLREFLAAADESFNVQGYAGSGKTHLVSRFAEFLNPQRTLLLAQTSGQLQALRKRAGEQFPAMTFMHAVGQVLDNNLLNDSWRLKDKSRGQYTWQVTHRQVAHWLNIPAIGHFSPAQVASICTRAVARFCNSVATYIDAIHLPAALAGQLSILEQRVLLEMVQRYWGELIQPSEPHIRLPIRGYHRIKLMALTKEVLDQQYTHIIVDEGHDIPTPMLQILDRSPQAVITLSDELQNLSGLPPERRDGIRQRSIAQSVRLGKQVEQVVNPLIQAHPSAVKERFSGRADHCTHLHYYSGWHIPNQPTTLIVADEFDLFAWFQRLTHAEASFRLFPSTFKDFMIFAQDCIELYSRGTRPRHGLIFRYASWDALSEAMAHSPSFQSIERMLQKGYSLMDFQTAVDRHMRKGQGHIILARVSDTKNMEFASVYLSKDLLVAPTSRDNVDSRAQLFSRLYTACTRAQHELIVPDGFSDWIADVVK
ncbi:AAA family ATPase [Denitrificimonas sp. JX-1]|uniref:AAA family ATPase n=1 Tax=Denitrificimonas halotolerans TaxID=3098930 RepID=A0ABU5GQY1_9GAMM|nr:AAA family ATPase [Denitrificimonas sp. JX-1]MDY7219130.1 AAA family ATPase [Denitrificimonas sp. JX-1]